MFDIIFEKLGDDYSKQYELLKEGSLVKAFESLKEDDSNNGNLLKGIILLLLKRFDKSYDKLISLENKETVIPTDIYYELLGTCSYELSDMLNASNYFKKSCDINPDNFYSKYGLANIMIKRKNYGEAFALLTDLHKMKPDDEIIINNLELVKTFL